MCFKTYIFAGVTMKRIILFIGLVFNVVISFAQPAQNIFNNPFNNPFLTEGSGAERNSKQLKESPRSTSTTNKTTVPDKAEFENDEYNDSNKRIEEEVTGANAEVNEFMVKEKVFNPDDIFGMDFFKTNLFSINENNIIAPPKSYRISSGDELIVSIWGPSQYQNSYTVAKDGTIFAKYAGKIFVQGLSFESTQRLIISKFEKIVAKGSNIDVQMGRAKRIKVTLLGELNFPGTYSMNSFNSVVNAISYAGGPTKLANLRNIELLRDGNLITTVDFYEFINKGNVNDDFLHDGDIVKVGVYEKLVKLTGTFKRPMRYILKEDETLHDAIDLAGGISYNSRASSISIKTIIDEKPKLLTLNLKELNAIDKTYKLADGDEVSCDAVITNIKNTVNIVGSVIYPGLYQLNKNERLLDIVNKAGGLDNTAFTYRAYIYRKADVLTDNILIKVNIKDLKENDFLNNVLIEPEDRISIISKATFKRGTIVEITGSIKSPTSIEFQEGLRLKDAIILAGGFLAEAENGRIEIASIIDSISTFDLKLLPNAIVKSYKINPNLEIDDEAGASILKPYDKIYVRKKSEFKLLTKVTLNGEVNYPGEYPIVNPSERISDILNRAGGLKEGAFPEGLKFTRSGLLGNLGVNLVKIIQDKNSIDNIVVLDGDVLNIPKKIDAISISGQVQNNISFFPSKDTIGINEAVDAAGGYKSNPWKKRIFVTYPNGKIKSTKSFLFFKIYPKVSRGSIVLIPEKEEKKFRFGDEITKSLTYLLGITSTIATLATTIFIFK